MPDPSPATTAPVYLSLTSAAARFDVSRKTIRRAIDRGELSAVRLGARGDLRVHVADLDRWARPVRNGAESER
ncbi:DNA-binding protein [Microbacterium sp. PI-1]|uniref:helix-turn-helix domain-containing protein n=1 Tax=Microbacterium sp. PI-1 TaxID=2545631 RepID=UPI001038C329|nr:helix-turn-helix domain-containing protein [Microbacterium sp. PI-1]TCJ29812.1 DNA-binding protein [Microbacterium sp. PI-1]